MFDNNNQDFESSRDRTTKMPVFIKAKEIYELVVLITDIVFDITANEEELDVEQKIMRNTAEFMRGNASLLAAKISCAEAGQLYDIKMTNAAIVRQAAMEISTQCLGLNIYGFKEENYLQVLRNEIEEFRILFAEWVKTFDEWDYIIDRWGLFNPPGVNYDDKDPDDDIPFDPNDIFDN